MAKLRYGIIGAGGCGKGKHLASYSLLADRVEIVAICDIIAEKADAAADQFGAEAAYTDYHEMLAEEKLDLVSVATPNFVHAPAAIAALDAGCHVHCEKPASMTPELVQDMVDAKNRSGKKLMIGLNTGSRPGRSSRRSGSRRASWARSTTPSAAGRGGAAFPARAAGSPPSPSPAAVR